MPKQVRSLSERLRVALEQRIAEGATLQQIADESNTQAASLSRFINGKAGLTISTLDRLSRVVRMRVET